MPTDCHDGVCSRGLSVACGLTLMDRVATLVEEAGAPSEAATDRDGVLSHAAESHALAAGLGVGFTAAAAGELRYFGVLYEGLILGNRGERFFDGSLLEDVKSEQPYFLIGLIAGASIGIWARVLQEAGHV